MSTLFLLPIAVVFFLSKVNAYPLTPVQESQIANFRSYLQIPTAHPSPSYAAAVDFLTSIAATIPNLRLQTLHPSSRQKPLLLLSLPGSSPHLPSLLLNSHLDSVPAEPHKWAHPPFSAAYSPPHDPRIFARGAQDDKSIAIQYIEALRSLQLDPTFAPIRSVHVSLVPDEEIGGADGWARFVESDDFKRLNVGFVLDEGQASPGEEYRVFYADRSPWSLVVRAVGPPGHGARMFEGGVGERVVELLERVAEYRERQFDRVKGGEAAAGDVVSVNAVFIRAGTASDVSPTVSVHIYSGGVE